MTSRVGFIGLGMMGRPMASNLMRAGYELVVYNRSQGAVNELVAKGAEPACNPREVAEKSEVVVTILPEAPDVERVLAGENGIFEGVRGGALIVDMSTILPVVATRLAREAAEREVEMLDAPVSGGDLGAREGTLSIMAGGSAAGFERARPLFEAMGKTVVHVGPAGTGQLMKACNQIVVALTTEALSEALVLASKAGVAPEKVLQVLSGGLASNQIIEVRGPRLLKRDFGPGGRVDFIHEALVRALEAARERGVSLPATALVAQMYAALKARGYGGSDPSVILTLLEDLAGRKVPDD